MLCSGLSKRALERAGEESLGQLGRIFLTLAQAPFRGREGYCGIKDD